MNPLDVLHIGSSEQAVARRLVRLYLARQQGWRYDAGGRCLTGPGENTLNLPNLVDEYRRTPLRKRGELLRRWVRLEGESDVPGIWVVARKGLRVAVRSPMDMQLLALAKDLNAAELRVAREFVPDLELRLVYDLPTAIATVSREAFETWGVSADEAFDVGLRNLIPGFTEWSPAGNFVLRLSADEGYEESRILVTRVIAELPFAEHAVLCAPNRGIVFAADGRFPEAIEELVQASWQCMREELRPLAATLFGRSAEGTWHSVDGPQSARNFAAWSLARDYAQQQSELEEANQRSEQDIFIAAYTVYETAGAYWSLSVWSDGIHAWLPRTDRIAFNREGEPVFALPWDEVQALVGSRMERLEMIPERYEVNEIGDVDWVRLRERAATQE